MPRSCRGLAGSRTAEYEGGFKNGFVDVLPDKKSRDEAGEVLAFRAVSAPQRPVGSRQYPGGTGISDTYAIGLLT